MVKVFAPDGIVSVPLPELYVLVTGVKLLPDPNRAI
jgi:hypothetical protein